jgi:hypothetical protein
VLAYVLDYLKRSSRKKDEVAKSVKFVKSHNRELYVHRTSPAPFKNRDFYSRQVWRQEADGSLMVVATPMESEEHPKLPHVVRGRFPLVMKLVKEGEGTKVEYLIQIDFGGSVPAQLTNSYMSSSLAHVTKLQQHFEKRLGLRNWSAEDGRLVGDAMCTPTDAEKHRDKGETAAAARVRDMFGSYAGLKDAGERFVFLPQLVTAAAENSLSLGADNKKRLDQLEEADGRKIGQVRAASEASGERSDSTMHRVSSIRTNPFPLLPSLSLGRRSRAPWQGRRWGRSWRWTGGSRGTRRWLRWTGRRSGSGP